MIQFKDTRMALGAACLGLLAVPGCGRDHTKEQANEAERIVAVAQPEKDTEPAEPVPARLDYGILPEEFEAAKAAIRSLTGEHIEFYKQFALDALEQEVVSKYGPHNKLGLINGCLAPLIDVPSFRLIVDQQAPQLVDFAKKVEARLMEIRATMTDREKLEAEVIPTFVNK